MPYTIFKEYSEEFFVEDKPFPVDYEPPVFGEVRDSNGNLLYDEILLKQETKDLLYNLTFAWTS